MPELISLLIRHRRLTWELARREISDRYAGQVLGFFWAIGHPLIFMGVYLFIFAVVFKVRINRVDGLPLNYGIYLLSGLIPWLAAQEALTKGVTAVVANTNLVKQVVFPIEVLPVRGVLTALFPLLVTLSAVLLYCALVSGAVLKTWFLLPVAIIFLIIGLTGLSFLLAAVGVYFRDLKDLVQVFAFIGIFLIPAFYLPDQVPNFFRPILYLNPFSYMVWVFQDCIYFGRIEHPWAWLVFPAFCLGSFVAGSLIFRRLKASFGNVL